MIKRTMKLARAAAPFISSTVGVLLVLVVSLCLTDRNAYAAEDEESCATEVAEPDEDIYTTGGRRVKVIDGDVFVCRDDRWEFEKTLIREVARDVEVRRSGKGCELVNTSTGERVSLVRQYSTGFEQSSFLDIFGMDEWSGTTLLSPKANTIKEYMKLNRRILKGGKFLDNRIDLVSDNVHSGRHALRFYAVDPGWWMKTTKSLVEKKNLCFGKGDDIWFSAWFYLDKNVPSTLFDFETRRMKGGPGIRLFIRQQKYASMELKFAHKPQYNQTSVRVPRRQWFNIRVHLYLSNHEDGLIEMWQDGTKVLSVNGRTLPTYDTVYHVMQLGITATSRETVLLVDDVAVSTSPP